MAGIEELDHALLIWLSDWLHPALVASMSAVTWLGSLAVLLPVSIILGWFWGRGGNWLQRADLPVAVLGAAAMAYLLKWAFDRERPDLVPSLIALPADSSFPSAHSFQVTAFVAAWLLWRGGWRKPVHLGAGLLLVSLVGLSRMYLQVHFPSDVFFGILGGLLWVWLLQSLPVWKRRGINAS